MPKGQKSSTNKSKKSKDTKANDTEGTTDADATTELSSPVPEEKPKLIKNVTIRIKSYEHILGIYPISDIKTEYKFMESVSGETTSLPINSDICLEPNHEFVIQCDVNSFTEMNDLISNPVIFTIIQTFGASDPEMYRQQCVFKTDSIMSYDSIVSLYEAFTGDEVPKVTLPVSKKKGKKGKGKDAKKKKSKDVASKGSKTSKGSKKSMKKESKGSVKKDKPPEYPPEIYGVCTLDLLPLFNGTSEFTESLAIKPLELYNDERMVTYKNFPKMVVSVSSEDMLEGIDGRPVIISLTVESIYNLPDVMDDEDMDFEICALLPLYSTNWPLVFKNPSLTEKVQEEQMKCWPGIKKLGNNANTTKYKLPTNIHDMKNRANLDIKEAIYNGNSRVEFNYIKRTIIGKNDWDALIDHLAKYNKIAVEIYMREKPPEPTASNVKSKSKDSVKKKGSKSDKSTKSSKMTTTTLAKDNFEYLHLMTILDLSYLLNPCTYKARIASPLTTFQDREAASFAGLKDSYFRPKPVVVEAPPDKTPRKKDKGKGKKDKKKGSKSSKSSKKSKKSKKGKGQTTEDEDGTNLKHLLPKEPEPVPEPEPSMKIFSEDGKQCFIIAEVILTECIKPKRNLDDIKENLKDLLENESTDNTKKMILSRCSVRQYFKETLNVITEDLNAKFIEFTKDAESPQYDEFEQYLRDEGIYENYLTSLSKATALYVTNKFQAGGGIDKTSKEYFDYIGQVYSCLVSEMHVSLNRLMGTDLQPEQNKLLETLATLLFYAKDATMRGQLKLAEKYYLERICYDENNANLWFEYAVYLLEQQENDKAFQCIHEGLLKEPTNPKCLLLYGILLADNNRKDDAELCFLSLLQNTCSIEVYGIMYLFYEKFGDYVNMDTVQEMIKKLDTKNEYDDFFDSEDLVWSKRPEVKGLFLRTAVYLLKMRIYNWVELALSYEISKHYGEVHYLLAAICYYRKLYDHALEHIQEAKFYCGTDCLIAGLTGLILLSLERPEEAKEEFLYVLEGYDQPKDLQLMYISFSRALDLLEEYQEARKYILLACKFAPTPYSWFQAGYYFFEQTDYLSAEECFTEANKMNTSLPEIWGYLCLVNLKLERIIEGEFCYRQAIKNKLEDSIILKKIKNETDVIKAKYNFPC